MDSGSEVCSPHSRKIALLYASVMALPEQSITIRTDGLTRKEVDSLKTALQAVEGVKNIRERHRTLDSATIAIQASAAHVIFHVILGYAGAQVAPGVKEFTKAVGKKTGDAVGDAIAKWIKRKFSGPSEIEVSVTIAGIDAEDTKTLQGKR